MFVPKQLDYNQLQTKAFFSVYKEWTIQPSNNEYFPGQLVKIFFNSLTDGVMDPYLSHLQITVSTTKDDLPVGLLQVDNSAQSFIDTMIITSNNRQVERIVQSSVLAAYLNDIGLHQSYCQGRQTQGFGYNNIDNYASIYTTSFNSKQPYVVNDDRFPDDENLMTYTSSNVFPTIPTKQVLMTSYGKSQIPFGAMNDRSHITRYNSAWITTDTQVWWWDKFVTSDEKKDKQTRDAKHIDLDYYGYLQNIRSQYLANYLANDYLDTNATLSKGQIMLDKKVQNNNFPALFANDTVYKTYLPDTLPYRYSDPNVSTSFSIPNISPLVGYTNLFSPNFSKGVREPFISPTVPQAGMKNGMFQQQKTPVDRRTFKIPLLSAVMGVLIPKNQFILLPLRAFNQTILQFTIDPFAMFTSGYNDISEYDHTGMGLMQKRAFKVEQIVYNLHTYQFYNPQMDDYLKSSLSTGIAINTHFWQLSNQYKIDDAQALGSAFNVACNQQALNQVVALFMPADYINMSFCRKHYRISNNITKMQLRMNMDYFPSLPLTGNAGNPIAMDSTGDNSIFLEQIALMRGQRFQKSQSRINAYNFALNDRPYNILNTHTQYDPSMVNSTVYQWNSASVNYDTAMGMANIHENRCVGKAAFVFSFAPYSHSRNLLTGIDCRQIKTFNLIFATNPDNWFKRSQQLYIFTRSANIIEYTQGNIRNINK